MNKSVYHKPGIARYFFTFFGADGHKVQSSVEEAVDDYLIFMSKKDPDGKVLARELEEFILRGLSEDELHKLIRFEWGSEGSKRGYGSWTEVLKHTRDYLAAQVPSNNY